MKKKGFTLVELLAVIVILTIIALVLVPLVTDIIESVKMNAVKSDARGIIEAGNIYYAAHLNSMEETVEFEVNDGVQVSTEKLEYKGSVRMAYMKLFPDNKKAVCVDDGKYVAYKSVYEEDIKAQAGICTGEWDDDTSSYAISNNGSGLVSVSIRSFASASNLPNNAKSTDISIITDNRIDGYYISSTEPTEKKEGMVWIVQDNNSSTYIETNNIKINVSYALQYLNGAWVLKDSYVYNDNWKELMYAELDNSVYYNGSDYVYEFNYRNEIQSFKAPFSGTYILEVWGAQGGGNSSYKGGYGGYAKGVYYLNKGEEIFVVTGGAGVLGTHAGGYNGGGASYTTSSYTTASGGGATHIAKSSGLLKDLAESKEEVIIVAGGGGGGQYYASAGYGSGGAGGGLIAQDSICSATLANSVWKGFGATSQEPGIGNNVSIKAVFGQGGGSTNSQASGGGGGFYGGGGGWGCPAGGGSGWIGGVFSYDDDIVTTAVGTNAGDGHARITLQTIQVLSDNEVNMIKNKTSDDIYTYPFSYTTRIFTAPKNGYYLLETWGAQGGSYSSYKGGLGGYSYGVYKMNKGEQLYITVGGSGRLYQLVGVAVSGGYNGGGDAKIADYAYYTASGGGATHIAKQTGQLKTLSSNKSDVLIVAGGGGGGQYYSAAGYGSGGSGGGTTGQDAVCSGSGSSSFNTWKGFGATQSSGGSGPNVNNGTGIFGQGGGYNSSSSYYSGGGGGLYGGGAGWGCPAAGGSGYLSYKLESSYKDYGKQTYSGHTNFVDAFGNNGTGRTGDGYDKISYLGN